MDVALDDKGRIVVAGLAWTLGNSSSFALARYTPDGTLDPTFDGDGKALTGFAVPSQAAAIAIHPTSGKVLVAGGPSID
jgi:hypothetical protein